MKIYLAPKTNGGSRGLAHKRRYDAIFRGLQEDIRNSLTELPNTAPTKLKMSLIKAHRKLSDYYTKLDESPYYVWSSCE